ncbi:MAG: serine hydrolase [Microscillaceae bacterium]|jgi:CubicO group peptidase (beta-lactamase class C family)|nr:serine hydrolase [Microscillaceae bacterium]
MKKTFRLILFFNLLILSHLTQSQTYEEKIKSLEPYIEKAMQDWQVPGLGLAVVYKNKLIYAKGLGYRDLEKKLPVTSQTIFAIGSATKAFVGVGIGQLVDAGKLDWNKPIRNYLPDFQLHNNFATQQMTAIDLLCHRSGLPRHDFMWYGSSFSRQELYERLRFLEPNADFRTKWQYQNLMFMTAGYLIEKLSNKTWEQYTKQNIFEPLGMKTANFSVIESQKSPDVALPYTSKNDKITLIPFRNLDAMGPAGSINANVEEMANWLIMQLNGGKFAGKEIISSSILAQTHTPQMSMGVGLSEETFYSSYAMGWFVNQYRGHLRVDHGGNIDGFSANAALYPKDSLGIVVLTNANGNLVTSIARNMVIDKLLNLNEIDWNKRLLDDRNKNREEAKQKATTPDPNQKKATLPSHPLADYAGNYEHPAYGIAEIKFEGKQLHIDFHTLKSPLNHYHYDIFVASDEDNFNKNKFQFGMNDKGEIDYFKTQFDPNVPDITFSRKIEPRKLTKDELRPYLGEYELRDLVIKVELKGENTLTLTVPGQPTYELLARKSNEFDLKDLKGYSTIFNWDTKKTKVIEVIFNQPNGVFTAKKK